MDVRYKDIKFERKIFQELLAWAKDEHKDCAILIEGARRVGKTTLVNHLAKVAYKDYLYIDFKTASDDVKKLFKPSHMAKLDDFFQQLFLLMGHTPRPGSLIIFDEVQLCLNAREDIKYLVADGRYDYIETGSLITILSNEANIQIPSEERKLFLHPMDFEEFLWAHGDRESLPILSAMIKENKRIPDAVHAKMMSMFRKYLVLGGMPRPLVRLMQTNSYIEAEKAKRDILSLYQDDLRKYDDRHETYCELIFQDIPSQLAAERESYRFVPGIEEVGPRSIKIKQSIHALKDFMMIESVYRTPDLENFLETGKDESFYKLYCMDVGLLLTALLSLSEEEVNVAYGKLLHGKKGLNMGAIYESYVAEALSSRKIKAYYHTYRYAEGEGKEKRYEIDFAFKYKLRNILLEVKSSDSYSTSSLDNIDGKYPKLKSHRYVIGSKNLSREERKTTLPIYLLCVLDF